MAGSSALRSAWREIDELLEHALGARGADVVLAQDFEQRGADHARHHRAIAIADGERRPDELRQIGDRIDVDRREGDRRQPVEDVEQRQHDQHAEPERWDRQPADGDDAHDIVDPGVAEQARPSCPAGSRSAPR